jgi:hypothetical protein
MAVFILTLAALTDTGILANVRMTEHGFDVAQVA